MKYSEAYEFSHNDLETKYSLHNTVANGRKFSDFKLLNTTIDRIHKNYFEVLSAYHDFFNEVYDKDWTLKVNPESEVSDYWKGRIASIQKTL